MNRPPESHKEIKEFMGLSPANQISWLKKHGTKLASETLAFVYRFGWSNGYKAVSKIAAEYIIGTPNLDGTVTGGRCEEIIKNQAYTFGLLQDPNQLMDFRQECYKKLIEDLNAGVKEKPFPEERFGRYLKLRAIDIGRALISHQQTRDTTEDQFVQWSESPPDAESIVLDDLTESEFHRIVLKLPPKVAQAFWLEWQGLPVQTKDKNTPSIATVMNISPTMVHKHLAKARAYLKQHPELLKMLRKNIGVG